MPCVIIKRIIPGVDFFAVLDTVFILGFKEIEDAFAVDTVSFAFGSGVGLGASVSGAVVGCSVAGCSVAGGVLPLTFWLGVVQAVSIMQIISMMQGSR